MKPILHVIFDHKKLESVSGRSQALNQSKKIHDTLRRAFRDDYKLIASPLGVDIVADNSTVVNLNIDNFDKAEDLVNCLNHIAEECKKEELGNAASDVEGQVD